MTIVKAPRVRTLETWQPWARALGTWWPLLEHQEQEN